MRRGVKTSTSLGQFALDPLTFQPDTGSVIQSSFRESTSYTQGRQLFDRTYLETNAGFGNQLTVEDANQKYGLDLKPTQTSTISEGLAQYFQQKKLQSQIDQSILQQGQPGILTTLGTGLVASMTDPVEFALNAFLPFTTAANVGRLAMRAGRFVRPGVAARFFARNPSQSILSNPFLAGVIEGGGGAALVSPGIYFNSDALGREYTLEDALIDIGVSAFAGGTINLAPHALRAALRGRGAPIDSPVSLSHELPIDPVQAQAVAAKDFASGKNIEVGKVIDQNKLTKDLQVARREIEQQLLTLEQDGATSRPVDFESPELQRHTNQLEKRLLPVTDPQTSKAEINSHAERINMSMAKLGELMAQPRAQFLEYLDDAHILQSEIIADIDQLNEFLPRDRQLSTDIKTTNRGIFRKDSLVKIGRQIKKLNDIAVTDDVDKITFIKTEQTRLQADYKAALRSLKQAQTKGLDTVDKWQTKVNELTPQLQHTQRLLQALGEDIEVPELSLQSYVDTLGGETSERLNAYLQENPEALNEPIYRVRRNIFNNVMRRMKQTEDFVQSIDTADPSTTKFPENDELLRSIRQELSEGEVDPNVIMEKGIEDIETFISDAKSLEIFDEATIKRFDKVESEFKERMGKVEALKKGSLQAQICALGGVT